MTREQIVDGLELYTVGRPLKSQVSITVQELQNFIDAIRALEQEPKFIAKSDGTIEQIKKCNDCLFKKEWEKIGKLLSVVLKKQVEQEPRWIPISERLPEDGNWNIFTDGKNISIERYKADAIDHFYPQGRWFSLDEVLAWMPLPKPYKAESEA